jgi:DNA-directed RNA polymerase specialized sigma24 family protein
MRFDLKPSRRDMTPEELAALLERLDPDPEKAARRFNEIHRRLTRLFEFRGCFDPESLAHETLVRVARRLLGGTDIQHPDPFGYCCGVAHRLYKEVLREQGREQQWRSVHSSGISWPEDPEEDRRMECLRHCLARLPEDQRRLILRYHSEGDRIRGRQALAQDLGIALNALRIRAHRIRRDLEECVRQRLARDP